MSNIDKRLVLQFEEGQATFRHVNHAASYGQIFALATALNGFQADPAKRILLVTVQQF